MSHELRTPVAGVISMAELLLADELGGAQRDLAGNIHRSAKTLLALVNDMLDFSQTGSDTLDLEAVRFYPLPLIQDVVDLLNLAAELKGVGFYSHIASDIDADIEVIGDPARLRQVLANLLTNSIEANQGHVKFLAQLERDSPERATLKFDIQDTSRAVEDTGAGDTPTARRSGRTEHGLSTSKSVIELMKGRIKLDSRPEVGTAITLWIPFDKPPCQQEPGSGQTSLAASLSQRDSSQRSSSSGIALNDGSRSSWRRLSASNLHAMVSPGEMLPSAQRASILVLVAEDNPINQKFALLSIKKLGFQATAVNDGQEALSYLRAAMRGVKIKPCVILMDIQMPRMDGYACAHHLRNHSPYKDFVDDVPIVALTASAVQGDKERCKSAGMDDYVPKPITIQTLERVLVRWSTQSRHRAVPLALNVSDALETSIGGGPDTPEAGSDQPGVEPGNLDTEAGDWETPEIEEILPESEGGQKPATSRCIMI